MSWWFLAGFYISIHLFTEAHSITSSLTLLSKLIRLKLAWQASAGCARTSQLQCSNTYGLKMGLCRHKQTMGSNLKGRNHIPWTSQETPEFLLQRLPKPSRYNIFYYMHWHKHNPPNRAADTAGGDAPLLTSCLAVFQLPFGKNSSCKANSTTKYWELHSQSDRNKIMSARMTAIACRQHPFW